MYTMTVIGLITEAAQYKWCTALYTVDRLTGSESIPKQIAQSDCAFDIEKNE